MALQLDGSATTIKRRNKRKRVRCVHCKDNIKLKKEIVYTQQGPMHLLCAGDVHDPKLMPCPTCFTIAPCLCVGT